MPHGPYTIRPCFVDKVLSEHSHTQAVFMLHQQMSHWDRDLRLPQSLKYSLSDPLQRKFAKPWTNVFLTLSWKACSTEERLYLLGWHLGPELAQPMMFHFLFCWRLYSIQSILRSLVYSLQVKYPHLHTLGLKHTASKVARINSQSPCLSSTVHENSSIDIIWTFARITESQAP